VVSTLQPITYLTLTKINCLLPYISHQYESHQKHITPRYHHLNHHHLENRWPRSDGKDVPLLPTSGWPRPIRPYHLPALPRRPRSHLLRPPQLTSQHLVQRFDQQSPAVQLESVSREPIPLLASEHISCHRLRCEQDVHIGVVFGFEPLLSLG